MDKKKRQLKKQLEEALEYYKSLSNRFILFTLFSDGTYYFDEPLIIKSTLTDHWIKFKMRKGGL